MAPAREALLAALRPVLAGHDGVALAVLFGSWAKGRQREASDVDVGIVPAGDLSLRNELLLQADLARAVHRPVDLVRLDRASTLVRWHAARDGVLIASRSHADWVRFRAAAACEHADFAPALRTAARLFQRRLSSGTGR